MEYQKQPIMEYQKQPMMEYQKQPMMEYQKQPMMEYQKQPMNTPLRHLKIVKTQRSTIKLSTHGGFRKKM